MEHLLHLSGIRAILPVPDQSHVILIEGEEAALPYLLKKMAIPSGEIIFETPLPFSLRNMEMLIQGEEIWINIPAEKRVHRIKLADGSTLEAPPLFLPFGRWRGEAYWVIHDRQQAEGHYLSVFEVSSLSLSSLESPPGMYPILASYPYVLLKGTTQHSPFFAGYDIRKQAIIWEAELMESITSHVSQPNRGLGFLWPEPMDVPGSFLGYGLQFMGLMAFRWEDGQLAWFNPQVNRLSRMYKGRICNATVMSYTEVNGQTGETEAFFPLENKLFAHGMTTPFGRHFPINDDYIFLTDGRQGSILPLDRKSHAFGSAFTLAPPPGSIREVFGLPGHLLALKTTGEVLLMAFPPNP